MRNLDGLVLKDEGSRMRFEWSLHERCLLGMKGKKEKGWRGESEVDVASRIRYCKNVSNILVLEEGNG